MKVKSKEIDFIVRGKCNAYAVWCHHVPCHNLAEVIIKNYEGKSYELCNYCYEAFMNGTILPVGFDEFIMLPDVKPNEEM